MGIMFLAQGHNTVLTVEFEPTTSSWADPGNSVSVCVCVLGGGGHDNVYFSDQRNSIRAVRTSLEKQLEAIGPKGPILSWRSIDHEKISTVILLLLLIQEGLMLFSYKQKYVHDVLVNRLVKLAQEKSVVR